MDPAVLNYLQQQQQSGQTQANNQQQAPTQGQGGYNPFDVGISRAIESARQSLGMTQKQQDKALRSSMLAFAQNMSQQPQESGFWNNFSSVGKALAPAISTYDQEEEAALGENNNLANQILQHQGNERDRQAAEEERLWRRQFAEDQLGETRRNHNLMDNFRREKNNSIPAQNPSIDSPIPEGFTPITNKAEFTAYAKDKKALGSTLQEVLELERDYKKFREDYQDNMVDPMSAFSPVVNPAKDYFGRFTANSTLRKETADRKTLESRLNKFVVSSERALKGGGVMGPTLIKMFKEQQIYPDLARDTPENFESKLEMLKGELQNAYKASNLSLQHGIRIDPYDINRFENQGQEELSNEEPPVAQPQTVLMTDPNGSQYQIPAEEVEGAIADGLMIAE